MEAKFFSEIEKNMDVKTIKDFEKEVRVKIYNELESLRKKNEDLSRVLIVGESLMWNKIRNEEYSCYFTCVVHTKTVIHLGVSECGAYLPSHSLCNFRE